MTGTTGPMKPTSPVPLLKKISGTISGSTGHHPHAKEESPLKTSSKFTGTGAMSHAPGNVTQSKPSYTGGSTATSNIGGMSSTNATNKTTSTSATSYKGLGVGAKDTILQPSANSQQPGARPTGTNTSNSTSKPSTNSNLSYTKYTSKK